MDGSSKRARRDARQKEELQSLVPGVAAVEGKTRLQRYQVGALPIINHYLDRLQLADTLRRRMPTDDARQEIPTERIVLLLVRNVLVSREPLYAVPEWVARHGPELFDLCQADIPLLHDDRLGGCLAKLFDASTPDMILSIVQQAIDKFLLSLDELHNDSTSVTFHGAYLDALRPKKKGQRWQPAITWGHNKDHRPDLKQLLFTLTLTNDGGVPLFFSVDSGNTNDDVTHRRTWDLLARLVGGPDFLYVADCKLASRENLSHIANRGGRFITVLPGGRREDVEFRRRLRDEPRTIVWEPCWSRVEEPDDPTRSLKSEEDPDDCVRVCAQEEASADGYRLLWFHSRRKARLDEESRSKRCQRAIQELQELQRRLALPRTRFRQRSQVEQEMNDILASRDMTSLLHVEIVEYDEESFRKEGRGRPSADSKYRREVIHRFDLRWHMDQDSWRTAQAEDGVFPLLTNDRLQTAKDVLQAYKRQPKIEKRFSQLKSDYNLAPVFLKTPSRVVGLFTVYFLALLVQALIERDLRNALGKSAARAVPDEARWEGSVDIYPEGRRTRRPTTRHLLDAFENIHRYEILAGRQTDENEPLYVFDSLTPTQERLLTLIGINPANYGR